MTVSLRKAHAYSVALISAAQKLNLSPTVEVSVYDETPATTINQAATALANRVAQVSSLFAAGYSLRGKISALNASAGISALLTQKAQLDATEKALNGLKEAASDDTRVAEMRVQAARKRAEEREYAAESVTVNVLTATLAGDIANQLGEIRRQKVEINDQLLALNLTTKVALSVEEERKLRDIGVI